MKRSGPMGWLAHDLTHRGLTAWALSAGLFAFYVLLYFGGQSVAGLTIPTSIDTLAQALGLDGKWTLYGALYSLAVTLGGVRVLRKYRSDRYQVVRTCVVMAVQVSLAFSVPLALKAARQPEYYFSYLWPLKIEALYPETMASLPLAYVVYGLVAALIGAPLLALFFGKRWYCSWVCGCGGLANTAGDPFRRLASTSTRAWRFEQISVHTVLALAVLTTLAAVGSALLPAEHALSGTAARARELYGLVVMSLLSGVVGVGLYPIGGTRVWCRYFCPMAALLGVVQRLGRFRIRVKADMCISCGRCSSACEMGIDVRAYAQVNESFTRAACVGCGLCANVCPRGVLRLESPRPPGG